MSTATLQTEYKLQPQVARIENLPNDKVTSIHTKHYRCPVDFTAWTDRKTCPKCGTPGELFKSTNRETLDTVELFDPILNQLDELELYARGSFIAIEPPELGTDLLTALEVAVDVYRDRIDGSLLWRLDKLATKTGESVRSLLNKAVKDYVEMWEEPDPGPSLVVKS
jgi:hypothetical protein